jgi:hypothetical protein
VCGGDLRLRCVCDDGDPCTSDDACNGFLVDEATRDRSGCRDGDAVRRGEAPSGVDDCPECHGTGRAACNDGNPRGGTRDAKEICDV